MRPPTLNYLTLVGFLLLGLSQASTATDADIPNYHDAREEYTQQRKATQTGSPFSTQDRQVMERAAAELARILPNPGLQVGQLAPDFTLPDAEGRPLRLSDQLARGPVILVFYRGAWCPFCNLHLHVLQQSLPLFKEYDARLIAVTPQRPDKSQAQIKKEHYPFAILSDLDDRVMRAYRLYYELSDELVGVYKKHGLDVEAYNGPGRTVLPIPGTFVIDTSGVIRAAHAQTDYKQRMEPEAIIRALREIKQGTTTQ